ncbi:amidase [Vibrio superstes]|nr:amidase [Vibrio superstes]
MSMNERDPSIYCLQGPDLLAPTNQGDLSDYRFVFKDLFDVEGYVTGAGNPKWLDTHSKAAHTSPVIQALLSKGAECVGRVQTDELAYSLNGDNVHYGTPINPLAPDSIPGGSSSGSAVAVALGHADFSIGTDTGGSVRVPASYCGLFGLRPSLGQLDLEHCFELSKSFDTVGIFSRELHVLASVFQSLTTDLPQSTPVETLYLDQDLAGILSAERRAQLDKWCDHAGISIQSVGFLDEMGLSLSALSLIFRTVQGFEIIEKHDQWLIEYGDTLDPRILERVKWARSLSKDDYLSAKSEQARFTQALTNAIKASNGLWLIPTTPAGPPKLEIDDDSLATYRTELMGLTSIAGLAGLPQLHLPMTDLNEGPVGVSLMGLPNSESQLIATAKVLLEERSV